MRSFATALLTLAVGASALSAQDFEWSERVPTGAWVRIYNLNGEVRVEEASGSEAEVVATKHVRRGEPEDVRIVAERDGESVTICALWHEEATCDESGSHHPRTRGRDRAEVTVRFTVRLPRGVNVVAHTVNGEVDVRGATAEVDARTVNGRVEAASSGGPVLAKTVNGSVYARMRALPGNEPLEFETVNGSIVVEVPAELNADLEMSTVNGSLTTDFPLTISGRISPKRLRGTLGTGGRRLELTTVNGSIELRRAP